MYWKRRRNWKARKASTNRWLCSRPRFGVAQAQLQQAQAELGAAQLQPDDTILRAPMAGVVTQKASGARADGGRQGGRC